MWFQAAECNAVNASLLLNLINNNFLIVIFLTENLPILNPCYPQNPKIYDPILVTLLKMRPHPAENPHKPLVRKYPPRGGYWRANEQEWIHYPYDVAICFRFLLTF